MLSDDASLIVEEKSAQKAAVIPLRITTTTTANAKSLKSASFSSAGNTTSKVFGGGNASFMDDEDDVKATRKLILLHDEELNHVQHPQQHATSNEDDDEVMEYGPDGLPLKTQKNTSMQETLAQISHNIMAGRASQLLPTGVGTATIPASVHAKVLAQAQAIAASLQTNSNNMTTSAASSSASVTVASAEDAAKEKLKKLADQIPSDKEGLFAYAIDWSALESQEIITKQLSSWIVKKIIEYLGEEEESLTMFIISKLQSRCSAEELIEELNMVLDADAEQFVMKLWKMLVFYSLKTA